MFFLSEECEVLGEKELSEETQSTLHETDKKRKETNGKKKGVFRSEWLNEFPFLKEYKPDKTRVTCMACNVQFSVYYGGKNDVLQHSKNKQHLNNILTFSIDRQLITSKMKPNREKDEAAAAEAALVYHSVRHGISYFAQQCTNDVLKILFVPSPIAKSLACGKTKAAAIATEVLAPYFTQIVLKEIQNSFYYSLSFDASTKGSLKFYPFCVQYFSDSGVKKG